MTAIDSDSHDYCDALVKADDEDRWLASHYLPPEIRRKIIALWALMVEVRRINTAVSEPGLGEIRLRWWRDALGEIIAGNLPRAHPVVEEIGRIGPDLEPALPWFDRAIEGHSRLLYGAGFDDFGALFDWAKGVSGGFDAGVARVATGRNPEQAVADAGGLFFIAREGRRLAPTLGETIDAEVSRRWKQCRAGLRDGDDVATASLLHLSLVPGYTVRAGNLFPVVKRLRLFTTMITGRF